MSLIRRLLELIWFCALGAALVISALTTDRKTRQLEENPSFCDPFGYLQMAQEIRQARAKGTLPKFTIDTPHTNLLVEFMQSQQVPVPVWDEMVAPLACHYFPAADHVALQYSPGAPLMLSLFPEGVALRGLNRLVIAVILLTGLALLVVAGFKRRPIAAGFAMMSLVLALEMLAQLNNASFSINALMTPLLLSGICLAGVWAIPSGSKKNLYASWLLTLVAGLLFGLAMLARMPLFLLLPGVMVVLWPPRLRAWYKSAWVPFVLGVFLGGVLPLMVHQNRVAGAWYLPTYTHENTTPPTLQSAMPNISLYFGPGKSGTQNLLLGAVFIGCLGLGLWSRGRVRPAHTATFVRPPTWTRTIAAALLMLLLSTIYFLTHAAANFYYPFPALFGAALLLALSSFGLEDQRTASFSQSLAGRGLVIVALLALLPGMLVIKRAWMNYVPAAQAAAPKKFSLPAELAHESAWIWACETSGTLWYFARKPAHKLTSTNAETRELVYRFVRMRNEPQYVVVDDESMRALANEIVQIGATLEHRGDVDGYPYYRIHWAVDGPFTPAKE